MSRLSCLILLLLWYTSVQAQSERSLLRDGNRSYKEDKFSDAEVNYRKALEKSKELPQGQFNLGDALYKQGRYAEAAEQYKIASAKNTDQKTKSQAYHNLGNALLKDKKLPESIAAYKDALKLSPNDMDTKYNLEYAKALLKKEQQQKNQQQKNDKQQQSKKQQQDQSKQDQDKKDQKQQQDQQKQNEQQANQDKQQQRQMQQKKQQISKEDAERILEAVRNEEKDVQKKLHKRVPARVKVEKDW